MILSSLDGETLFYRAHLPQWASQPMSGAGAARHGGRLNRPGTHALYLSDSPTTAIAEYQQLATLMPPCTLATYSVRLDRVVDFREGYVASLWGALWQELNGNWRKQAILEKIEPPSWLLADEVLAAGLGGVLFRSILTQGVNLVVYTERLGGPNRVEVHDPERVLPQDRSSWE